MSLKALSMSDSSACSVIEIVHPWLSIFLLISTLSSSLYTSTIIICRDEIFLKPASTSANASTTRSGLPSPSSAMAFVLPRDVVSVFKLVQSLRILARMRVELSPSVTPCRPRLGISGKSIRICRMWFALLRPIWSTNEATNSESHVAKSKWFWA